MSLSAEKEFELELQKFIQGLVKSGLLPGVDILKLAGDVGKRLKENGIQLRAGDIYDKEMAPLLKMACLAESNPKNTFDYVKLIKNKLDPNFKLDLEELSNDLTPLLKKMLKLTPKNKKKTDQELEEMAKQLALEIGVLLQKKKPEVAEQTLNNLMEKLLQVENILEKQLTQQIEAIHGYDIRVQGKERPTVFAVTEGNQQALQNLAPDSSGGTGGSYEENVYHPDGGPRPQGDEGLLFEILEACEGEDVAEKLVELSVADNDYESPNPFKMTYKPPLE